MPLLLLPCRRHSTFVPLLHVALLLRLLMPLLVLLLLALLLLMVVA